MSVHSYCVCQILFSNAINTTVTDMGYGTNREIYHFNWFVPRPLYILILPSITIIYIALLCVKKILCNYNTHVHLTVASTVNVEFIFEHILITKPHDILHKDKYHG
jgi:hypothetical protein